ncbi:putative beta-N-acetylhexosaminidase domain protein [Burkholderia pseudomallei MSHR332]|nr:putative beta-N-acetylhexosaminidase domain protein [Burkholderia pseudomallei MSHR332]
MSAGSRRGATTPHTGTRAPSRPSVPARSRSAATCADGSSGSVSSTPRRSSAPGSARCRFTLGSARFATGCAAAGGALPGELFCASAGSVST